MSEVIELINCEIFEFCSLNRKTGEKIFYKGKKKTFGFTGLYFNDNDNFFALFPTINGPMAFYQGREYPINKDLAIIVQKENRHRKFEIKEYDIVISYIESPYIGFDIWSNEVDVDLFCMIEQRYKSNEFYEQFLLCQ